MAHSILEINEYLSQLHDRKNPVLDVRSESEYLHAHLPGAINLPLLRNEERKIVGTIYKNEGKDAAMLKGFELVGPRFHDLISKARTFSPSHELLIYCWRGGMRSNIMAWLLSTSGIRVSTLAGGYKSYRNWVLNVLDEPREVLVVGGKTGTGKTRILKELEKKGEQVLDLEGIANHKGSAFGALGQNPQPSNEYFENIIAMKWSQFKNDKPVWIENESRSIGSNILPSKIYALIRNSILLDIHTGIEARMNNITNEYGCFSTETLTEISHRIKKRLGPQHLKTAVEHLEKGNFNGWLEIILAYYDRLYEYGNTLRSPSTIVNIELCDVTSIQSIQEIIKTGYQSLYQKAQSINHG